MATSKKMKSSASKLSEKTEFYDIWDSGPPKTTTGLNPELEDYYLKQVKKKQPLKFVPKTKKNRGLPAVETPHPGSSYNPALDDHLVLLLEAEKTEKAKLKEERRVERILKLPPASQMVTPEIKLKEAREGLNKMESDDDDEETDDAPESYRPAVAPISAENRKLKAVRKREKLRKQQEKEKRDKKLSNMRQSEIFRLRSIKKDIKKREEISQKKKEAKKRRREELEKVRPPKLSSVRYEVPDPEVQLSTEICGSLRHLKPEGNLLEDRYKSLQKRGVVEPRTMQNHRRKYRLKKYEKRSHRDMPDGYLPR